MTPNTAGTRISAITGFNRFVKIRNMNTAIMAKPRPTSIGRLLSAMTLRQTLEQREGAHHAKPEMG